MLQGGRLEFKQTSGSFPVHLGVLSSPLFHCQKNKDQEQQMVEERQGNEERKVEKEGAAETWIASTVHHQRVQNQTSP